MADGYILLHKRIQDNWLWSDKPFSKAHAWIDLLLMANYTCNDIMSKGAVIHIERGQVFRSIKCLSERWGWSIKKTKGFIKVLEKQNMVSVKGLPQGTLITIEKYDSYQTLGRESGPSEGLTKDQAGTNQGPQKIKDNKRKRKSREEFTPPTLEEVEAYCREKNNGVDPVSWWNFYNSKNWMVGKNKMKNWKSAIVTWERRNKPADTTPQRPKRTQDEIAADIAHAQGMTLEEFKRAYNYD